MRLRTMQQGVCAIAVALVVVCAWAAPSGARESSGAKEMTITSHTDYLDCDAPGVLMTASMQRGPFHLGQAITVHVSMRNLTNNTCDYPNQAPPKGAPATSVLSFGGCGEVQYGIENYKGEGVYSSVAPQLPCTVDEPVLPPGATMSGSFTWSQTAGQGPFPAFEHLRLTPGRQVPRGQYVFWVSGPRVIEFVIRLP